MAIAFVSGSSNGSTATSIVVTAPAGIVAGNVLLAFFESGSGTGAAPSGWTAITSTTSDGRQWAWYKVATGSEPGSYTFTGNSYNAAVILQYSGVNTTTPLDGFSANGGFSSPATTAAFTNTVASDMLVMSFSAVSGYSISAPAGVTARNYVSSYGNYAERTYELALTTAGTVAAKSGTNASSDSYGAIAVALQPTSVGGAAFTGSAALTGSGTLTGSGVAAFLAYSGTLATSGNGAVALTGSPGVTGTLTASGSGTLAATGVAFAAASGSLLLTGDSQFALTGAPALGGALTRAGPGQLTLSGTAFATATGALTLSGAGGLAMSGVAFSTASGTLVLAGSGSLTQVGVPASSGTLALAGVGQLATTGTPAVAAALALSGSGGLTTSATITTTGTLTLAGDGTLMSQATTATSGTLARTGTGTLTATATPNLAATTVLTGAGVLTATATIALTGGVDLTGTGTLAGIGSASTAGAGTLGLSGTGQLTTTGSPATSGTLPPTGTGTLSTSAAPATSGTLARVATGTLALSALPAVSGMLPLAGTGALTVSGAGSQLSTGTLALTGTGTLAQACTPGTSGTLALAGTGALTGTGTPGAPNAALWTPNSIPGLALWLDATTIPTQADGTPLNLWSDTAGTHHGTPPADPAGAYTPKYRTNILGNLPAIEFNGSQALDLAGMADTLSGDDTYTLIVLNQSRNFGAYPIMFTWPVDAGWSWVVEYDTAGNVYWGHGSGSYWLWQAGVAANTWPILALTKTAATAGTVHGSGTDITTHTSLGAGMAATPTMTGPVRMGSYYTHAYGIDGYVAEVLYYPTALSPEDLAKAEGYLAWKWGRVADLPAAHPYKTAAPVVPGTAATTGTLARTGSGTLTVAEWTAPPVGHNITVTAALLPRRWSATIDPRSWSATLTPRRWEAHL